MPLESVFFKEKIYCTSYNDFIISTIIFFQIDFIYERILLRCILFSIVGRQIVREKAESQFWTRTQGKTETWYKLMNSTRVSKYPVISKHLREISRTSHWLQGILTLLFTLLLLQYNIEWYFILIKYVYLIFMKMLVNMLCFIGSIIKVFFLLRYDMQKLNARGIH